MIRILGTLLLAAALGSTILAWRLNEVKETRDDYRVAAEDLSRAYADLETETERVLGLYTKVWTDNQANLEILADANAEIRRLERGIANGTIGLRVNATCPAVQAAEPAEPAGVADDRTCRLTPDAEQGYIALREQLTQSRSQILGLQQYAAQLLEYCRGTTPEAQ